MSTDRETQPLTNDGSFPISVHKTAYQETFRPAAWRGILDFHEHASRLEEHSKHTQMFTSDKDYRLDTRLFSDNADHSVTIQKQCAQAGLDMPNREPTTEGSPAKRFTRLHHPFLQPPTNEDVFLDGIDDIMTEQVPFATPLNLDGLQVVDNISGTDTTFVPSDIDQSAMSTAQAPSHMYNDLGDESSIETLLEELSAQQNVSWDEMEAQCMYNLGFMQPDHTMH